MRDRQIFSNWYCYILVFLLIYLEWGYAPVVAQNISGVVKTAMMILSVLPLCFYSSLRINRTSAILFAILTFVILLSAVRDADIENSILLFVPIFCAFIITCAYPAERIIEVFCNVITFLAVYSLIIYSLAFVVPSFISSFPVLPSALSISVHNLGLAVIPLGVNVIRNPGITWEPGAFALLLCLSIFGQIVGYNKISKRKLIISIIALVTTLSTLGFIVLAAIIVITRLRTGAETNSKTSNILLLLLICVSIIFLSDSSSQMYETVFGKLSGFSLDEENVQTTQDRINAIIYPGLAFLSNPLIGVGYDVFKFINESLCHSVATNTIVNWFAIGGITLGIPCTYFYLKAILKASAYLDLNIILKVALVVTFMFLVSTESLLRISLIYVIIFYGCLSRPLIKHA